MSKYLSILSIFLATIAGCTSNAKTDHVHAEKQISPSDQVPGSGLADESVATLHVRGMSCPLCANNIDRQLLKIPGVEKVAVNLGNGEVRVRLASNPRPTREQLTQAIAHSGFTLARIEMPGAEEK